MLKKAERGEEDIKKMTESGVNLCHKIQEQQSHVKQQKLFILYDDHSHYHFSQWTLAGIVCLERQAPELNRKQK